jgi:Uma2 family endonuclease
MSLPAIFTFRIRAHLKGSPCKIYLSDIKLEVSAADSVFYPDLFVTCETPSDPLVKRDAALIIEILSPSTEAYDRGRKFGMYRLLPGLKEYLLIGTDEALVEVYRRTDDEAWLLRTYRPGDTFTLASIDLQIAVDDVFDDIDFSPASDTV